MKNILIVLGFIGLFLLNSSGVDAYVRVRGYFRKSSGTYVMPHYRTYSNSYKFDNWSYKGNINPFNGRVGYKW